MEGELKIEQFIIIFPFTVHKDHDGVLIASQMASVFAHLVFSYFFGPFGVDIDVEVDKFP